MIGQGGIFGGMVGIKSIQTGTITVAGATGTATITSVDVNNAFVVHEGSRCIDTTPSHCEHSVQLTNATTVTATVNAHNNAATVQFTVVEFYPGVLRSVQPISIALVAANSNTGAISSVDTTKAFIVSGGRQSTSTGASDDNDFVTRALTNATTVTVARAANGGFTLTEFLTVVEFY